MQESSELAARPGGLSTAVDLDVMHAAILRYLERRGRVTLRPLSGYQSLWRPKRAKRAGSARRSRKARRAPISAASRISAGRATASA